MFYHVDCRFVRIARCVALVLVEVFAVYDHIWALVWVVLGVFTEYLKIQRVFDVDLWENDNFPTLLSHKASGMLEVVEILGVAFADHVVNGEGSAVVESFEYGYVLDDDCYKITLIL